MALPQDRLQADEPEIVITSDPDSRVQRVFAMVEDGAVIECPFIVNGIEEARLRWVARVQPGRRGVAYLRLRASDNCKLDKLKRDPEPEPEVP